MSFLHLKNVTLKYPLLGNYSGAAALATFFLKNKKEERKTVSIEALSAINLFFSVPASAKTNERSKGALIA